MFNSQKRRAYNLTRITIMHDGFMHVIMLCFKYPDVCLLTLPDLTDVKIVKQCLQSNDMDNPGIFSLRLFESMKNSMVTLNKSDAMVDLTNVEKFEITKNFPLVFFDTWFPIKTF